MRILDASRRLFALFDLCVSSWLSGHGDLLSIDSMLMDDPRKGSGVPGEEVVTSQSCWEIPMTVAQPTAPSLLAFAFILISSVGLSRELSYVHLGNGGDYQAGQKNAWCLASP